MRRAGELIAANAHGRQRVTSDALIPMAHCVGGALVISEAVFKVKSNVFSDALILQICIFDKKLK